MTDNHHFWNLLAKKLSGEASPDELVELGALLKLHPEWSYTTENLSDIWALHPQATTTETEAAFQKHSRLLQDFIPTPSQSLIETTSLKNRFARPVKLGLSVAVALLMIVGFGIWLKKANKKELSEAVATVHSTEMSTTHGSRSKLVLPDSSVVWLNSGSRLTYDKDFGTSNRATQLTGEAFFEVRKGKTPFTVQAAQMHIKVMGTAFNVKAYDNEPVETSLIHGRVEVTLDKRPGEPFYLKPNEKFFLGEMKAPAKGTLPAYF